MLIMKKPSRNHLEILSSINELLVASGFSKEAEELINEISTSYTGSELCMRCGSILLIYRNNKKLNQVIGKQIDEFNNYCQFNGLLIKPRN